MINDMKIKEQFKGDALVILDGVDLPENFIFEKRMNELRGES